MSLVPEPPPEMLGRLFVGPLEGEYIVLSRGEAVHFPARALLPLSRLMAARFYSRRIQLLSRPPEAVPASVELSGGVGRAALRTASRRGRRRPRRLGRQLHHRARPASGADHDHARHGRTHLRTRQRHELADRRHRRAAGGRYLAAARPVRFRPVGEDSLLLRPGRAVRRRARGCKFSVNLRHLFSAGMRHLLGHRLCERSSHSRREGGCLQPWPEVRSSS